MTVESPSTIRHDTGARHLKKYSNRNPIHRFALSRFFNIVAEEVLHLRPRTALEFGCGEGLFLKEIRDRGLSFAEYVGVDLRADALDLARSLHPDHRFVHADLLTWSPPVAGYDLVIAAQVLEHIPAPTTTFERLVDLCTGHLLLTVPWEPWFRILNLLRGRDLRRLGNHPEHVNQWTFGGFKNFVAAGAEVVRVRRTLPFTVVVAKPLGADETGIL